MSGRTAGGLVLIVVGVMVALWGINLMNSLGTQIAGRYGMQDNTGPVAAGGGCISAIIGLALAITGSSTSQRDPRPYRCPICEHPIEHGGDEHRHSGRAVSEPRHRALLLPARRDELDNLRTVGDAARRASGDD